MTLRECASMVVVVGIVGAAKVASAQAYHVDPICQQDFVNAGTYNGTLGINADHQYFDSATGDDGVQVICPVPVSNTSQTVKVAGWSTGTGSINAQICRQPVSGGVPNCGTLAKSSGTGAVNFSVVPPSYSSGDFLFLEIGIGSSIGLATVWGYTVL